MTRSGLSGPCFFCARPCSHQTEVATKAQKRARLGLVLQSLHSVRVIMITYSGIVL